jgi:hypothetical protein
MKTRIILIITTLVWLSTLNPILSASPLGTAFTYHGQLQQSGSPVNSLCDFQFSLWDASTTGTLIGTTQAVNNVSVSNGLFTALLDFGAGAFNGDARWLEIAVRAPASGDTFTLLAPRQAITATPYALQAATADTAANVPVTNITGRLSDSQVSTNVALLNSSPQFTGTVTAASFSGDAAGLTRLNPQAIGNGDLITVVSNGGAYGFAFAPATKLPVGAFPYGLASGDVNGDGWVDLISANFRSNSLTVYTNSGGTGLVLATHVPVPRVPVSVVTIDVNCDGRLDLISGSHVLDEVTVLTNDGRGGFLLSASQSAAGSLISIAVADLNGDHYPDIVTVGSGNSEVLILTNDGRGVLGNACLSHAYSGPTSVAVADVNEDGAPDVVTANIFTDNIAVFTNSGLAALGLPAFMHVGPAPTSIIAGDLNRDGHIDLACTTSGDSMVTVFWGDGKGGFSRGPSLQVDSGPGSLVAVDINRDGWLDLVTANRNTNTLSVLTNDRSGSFAMASSLEVGNAPFALVAADINGDGYVDLISADSGDNTLSVLLQVSPMSYVIHSIYVGDGGGITNIQGSNIVGPLREENIPGQITHSIDLTNPSNHISGDGFNLTDLNASSIRGTVSDTNLPANVARLGSNQTFTGVNTFLNPSNLFVGTMSGNINGNGAGLTNLSAANLIGVIPDGRLAGTYTSQMNFSNPLNNYSGSGTNLTSLNASSLVVGTIADARLSTNVAFLDRNQTFSGANNLTNTANRFVGSFAGDGSALTNLPPSTNYGGTITDAMLPATAARLSTNQTFSGANNLTNPANSFVGSFTGSFTGNGAGLTNLPAGNLTGSIPDAQLSLNVPRLNGSPVFSGPVAAPSFAGSGASLSNLDATALASGTLPNARLGGSYSSMLSFTHPSNSFVGRFSGDGSALTNVGGLSTSNCWQLTGNSGTTPKFLGTTDSSPLEVRVNDRVALRILPTTGETPNWIGGASGNSWAAAVVGATIGGGGGNAGPFHWIGGDYGTIGGGERNTILTGAPHSTISGGFANQVSEQSYASVIGGGEQNSVYTGAWHVTISGGAGNSVFTGAYAAVVGGGEQNTIGAAPASGSTYATIGGGSGNVIKSSFGTIGGGQQNVILNDGVNATIAGGWNNSIQSGSPAATIGGGRQNTIQPSADDAAIGGGRSNTIQSSSQSSVIGGGRQHQIKNDCPDSTISGGAQNTIESLASQATIGGGWGNIIKSDTPCATIPGGAGASATKLGQLAYASGSFAAAGDAQTSVYVLRGTSSGGSQLELFLDGVSRRMTIPSGATWSFDILVVGRTNGGKSGGYHLQGLIENVSGSTQIIASVTKTVLGEDDTAWDATALADDTADALAVKVTGKAGDTIRWVATVRTAEVSF